MDSIIERTRFSGMVNCEFGRFIFIPSQISSFCSCQTDFSEFRSKPHWVRLPLMNSTSSTAKSSEGEAPRPSSQNCTQIFIPSLLQNFTRLRITLVKINGAEQKPKGRTVNIKYLIFRQFSWRNPNIFGDSCQCQCDGNLGLYRIYVENLCCLRNPA